jgi:hypothetical protein
MCELASLAFMMYNMGEGDYKSILLEDPTGQIEKRSSDQIA